MNEDPTNFWDVAAIFIAFSYSATQLGAIGYAVQFWGWSAWWFLLPLAYSPSVRTGRAAWKGVTDEATRLTSSSNH